MLAGLVILLLSSTCTPTEKIEQEPYPRWIGDISFNAKLDDPDFKVCDENGAVQYFWFNEKTYQGEKILIEDFFQKNYRSDKAKKESGLLRIRFLVNCEGKAGRFRVKGMDKNYQEKEFDASITRQLLRLTKELDQWKVLSYKDQVKDYYQYLIFKIEEGVIKEILP